MPASFRAPARGRYWSHRVVHALAGAVMYTTHDVWLPAQGRRAQVAGRATSTTGAAWPYSSTRSFVRDRKSTRLNSSHVEISYAVFCLKKKTRERAGVDASSAGMVAAGFETHIELTKRHLDNY